MLIKRTSWNKIILQELTGAELFKQFYGVSDHTTVFTKPALDPVLGQLNSPHTLISLACVLILFNTSSNETGCWGEYLDRREMK
jgi:hypothetical protein